MSCTVTYSDLIRFSTYLFGCWWVGKSWWPFIDMFFANWYGHSMYVFQKYLQRSNFNIIFKHKSVNLVKQTPPQMLSCVLKFLEQLSEYLQMDDSTVKERMPTKIHLWKFQASKHLCSNPRLVHLSARETLRKFWAFYLRDDRSSCCKIAVIENFAKFTCKNLYQSIFPIGF